MAAMTARPATCSRRRVVPPDSRRSFPASHDAGSGEAGPELFGLDDRPLGELPAGNAHGKAQVVLDP